MRTIPRSPTISPCDSSLILSMKRSMDEAISGRCSRSQAPSHREGIAANSSALMLTIPVTWLMEPS